MVVALLRGPANPYAAASVSATRAKIGRNELKKRSLCEKPFTMLPDTDGEAKSYAEHSGTHIDAPFIISREGIPSRPVPLDHLIGPCRCAGPDPFLGVLLRQQT